MDIDLVTKEIHQIALDHGWWDYPRPFPETVALCHSELSEALEEYRNDSGMFYISGGAGEHKPEGVAVEMADCMIRIMDWFGYHRINPSDIIANKIHYNRTRPYRHGNKKA